MGGINFWWISGNNVMDARELFGLPLGFYPKGSFIGEPPRYPPPPTVEFSISNFFIDIIFWYMIACLIYSVYDCIKHTLNKRKKLVR
jgi:hypothetical protein